MLALNKLKRNLPICYLHNSTNEKAGLAGFQIGVLAKYVGKHKLHTHRSGCSLGTTQNRAQREQPKAQLPKGAATSLALQLLCVQGEGRPEEEEQRTPQQSGFTEGELSLLVGKASAGAV